MTKKRFSSAVEMLVVTKKLNYIDAITHIVEERGMEYSNVKRLLSDSIRQKLTLEARLSSKSELKLITTTPGNKLPLQENTMSTIIIPSSDADRKIIKDAMTELSNSMVRIESEKNFIKEAIEELNDKVGIDKKHLRKLANVYHKQTLAQVTGEMEDLEALYESCLK